jgi:hypothetical protein
MDRCYFTAVDMVVLRHDRHRLKKSVPGLLAAMGMPS